MRICPSLSLFTIPGTATLEEKEKEAMKQVRESTLKFANYTLATKLNANLPGLDALYDLLAAMGKAFFLSVKVTNNDDIVQEIPFDDEMGMVKPLREFTLDLKDEQFLKSYKLDPISNVITIAVPMQKCKTPEIEESEMCSAHSSDGSPSYTGCSSSASTSEEEEPIRPR